MDQEKDQNYMEMRRENDRFIKAMTRSYARKIEAQEVGEDGETIVANWLRERGLTVEATDPNAPYDLSVTNPATGRTIRVEVKTSSYNHSPKGGRYQARIHHPNADLVVFVARNGKDWPFIIPMKEIGSRKNLAIWSKCPGDYRGIWSRFLNGWQNLEAAF